MKKFYVYVHTCKANGKKYVGCTTQKVNERWHRGKGYWYNKHFYSAILKYGWDNFEHEVFEVSSKEEMYRKEVELISFYHSNDPRYGYNHSAGGEKSASGCKCSEETRKKHSEDNLKRWADPEYRKKMSEAHKKKWTDPEVRRKKSEDNLKRWSDPEYRKRVSEALKRRNSDPEVRRKRSEAHKGKHLSEEHRKHIIEAKKGKPRSEETKRRISETLKGKPLPRVKIQLPDGTIIETTKQNLSKNYINKGRKFEYVS